jgi:hypothetical protein
MFKMSEQAKIDLQLQLDNISEETKLEWKTLMENRPNMPQIDLSGVEVTKEMKAEFQAEQMAMLNRVYGDEEIPETLKHWFD